MREQESPILGIADSLRYTGTTVSPQALHATTENLRALLIGAGERFVSTARY